MKNGKSDDDILTTLIKEELEEVQNLPKSKRDGTHQLTTLLAKSEIAARNTRSDILMLAQKSHTNSETMLRKQDVTNGRVQTLEENMEHLYEHDLPERMDTLERYQGRNYAKIKKWDKWKERVLWTVGTLLSIITLIGVLRSAGIDVYRLVEQVETTITEKP